MMTSPDEELSPKQIAFIPVIIRIWRKYESFLKAENMIDFDDMINEALNVAKADGPAFREWKGKYSHILVDEFQDITDAQLELIQSLVRDKGSAKLFCVGDDWQNIYSFAGSNPYNLIDFEQRFPFCETSLVSTNYRCPKNVVEASNSVIERNKFKREKQVVAHSDIECPIHLYEMPDDLQDQEYDQWERRKANELNYESGIQKCRVLVEQGENLSLAQISRGA